VVTCFMIDSPSKISRPAKMTFERECSELVVSNSTYLPERETRSVVFRPRSENFRFKTSRPSEGPGRSLAAVWFAVVPSLLPSKTSHEGPPACSDIN
jgi:hypothetical protein